MAVNRSASDVLLGYFYQFDHTIIQLLELTNKTATVTVEGIEDIDIDNASDTTAIQCKYYSKTGYNHSVIAKPIRYMLNHFKNAKDSGKPNINYKIYGYYKSGQDKLTLPMDIAFLKDSFLTYSEKTIEHKYHIELNISDFELNEFLNVLQIDINACDYNEQFKNILDILKKDFNCNDFEAEYYYYNNALRLIKEIAIKEQLEERKITKGEFLSRINTKSVLFNEWFYQLKGKKQHYRRMRSEYFTNLNSSPFERFFLIELPDVWDRNELKELIFILARKWSKLSKRETNTFCPYIYLHNISDDKLLQLKNEFAEEEFKFIDGYDFKGADFSTKSLLTKATYQNQIKIKFLNDLSFVDDTLQAIKKTKEVFNIQKQNLNI